MTRRPYLLLLLLLVVVVVVGIITVQLLLLLLILLMMVLLMMLLILRMLGPVAPLLIKATRARTMPITRAICQFAAPKPRPVRV